MIGRLCIVYVLSVYITSVSCDCFRGFEESDRPFINAITSETVRRSEGTFPLWSKKSLSSGGNLVVDETERTNIIVPASGNYAIFVRLQHVYGHTVHLFLRRAQSTQQLITQQPVIKLGTTICGSVSFLEVNDRVSFWVDNGMSTSSSSLQLFAYLINLSS
jgi:hypothetical protein